jgi:hypothetical protein
MINLNEGQLVISQDNGRAIIQSIEARHGVVYLSCEDNQNLEQDDRTTFEALESELSKPTMQDIIAHWADTAEQNTKKSTQHHMACEDDTFTDMACFLPAGNTPKGMENEGLWIELRVQFLDNHISALAKYGNEQDNVDCEISKKDIKLTLAAYNEIIDSIVIMATENDVILPTIDRKEINQ